MSYEKGDIYYIENPTWRTDKNPQSRPGVIVSNNVINNQERNVMVVWLVTNDINPLPCHPKVLSKVRSIALCDMVSTVHVGRVGEFVRSCTEKEMKAIDEALVDALGVHVDNSEELKVLQDKLSEAEESFCSMQHDNELLENTLKKMEEERALLLKQIDDLSGSINDSAITKHINYELIKAQAERDMYKLQFEQLLERMIG